MDIKQRVLKGVLIGASVGSLTGSRVGVFTTCIGKKFKSIDEMTGELRRSGNGAAVGSVMGMVIGGIAGAILGALNRL